MCRRCERSTEGLVPATSQKVETCADVTFSFAVSKSELSDVRDDGANRLHQATSVELFHGVTVEYKSWTVKDRIEDQQQSQVTGLLSVNNLLVAKLLWEVAADERAVDMDSELVAYYGAIKQCLHGLPAATTALLPSKAAECTPELGFLMICAAFAVHRGPGDSPYALLDFVTRRGFMAAFLRNGSGKQRSRLAFRPDDVIHSAAGSPGPLVAELPSSSTEESSSMPSPRHHRALMSETLGQA